MKPQDYFVHGCKLFGVYCFVLGIPALATLIPTFIQPQDLSSEYKKIYTATVIATRLIPILYIAIGLFLLRGEEYLLRFAYSRDTESSNKTKEKLNLFLKFLGIFLVISYFPDLLRTISSYIAYSSAPKYFDMNQEKNFFYVNAASSIWGVACGVYLLKGGKIIERFALHTMLKVADNDTDKVNG